MKLRSEWTDAEFDAWFMGGRSEDELRDAYVALEAERAALWTPGHIESFRRDRFERDAVCISRLVRVKQALARHWEATGQLRTNPFVDRVPA
ncbi:MAG TPA: hypothetical protein VMT43_03015 [Acidimicrobiales bacterium]|nr:hypothetical protein [Acidimicrobiales bacterium]